MLFCFPVLVVELDDIPLFSKLVIVYDGSSRNEQKVIEMELLMVKRRNNWW